LAQRVLPGRKRICCPTNLLRTFAQLQSYFYSHDDDGLWVHHFGGNTLDHRLADGNRLMLTQKTDYPWDGKITVSLDDVATTTPFAIRLRIPGWASGATVSVNGTPTANTPEAGEYLFIKRPWRSGDLIELNLPMPARLMQAHPKAEQLRNQVAVMRGPMLYCLESKDLPASIDLNNVYLPDDIELEPVAANDLPFGMTALTGEAVYRAEPPWSTELYRLVQPRSARPLPIRLIPYFAWANRGPAAMSVWLPVTWSDEWRGQRK
jgi:hypothetical protein